MGRYIICSSGGEIPVEQRTKLRAAGVTVVDDSPTMLLVDGDEQAVNEAVASMKDVTVYPEMQYKVPSPHPSVPKPVKSPKPAKRPKK